MVFGIIDQPVTLATKITVQRLQRGPELSGRRRGPSAARFAPELMHNRADAVDTFLRKLGFSIPHAPVSAVDPNTKPELEHTPADLIHSYHAGNNLRIQVG